MLKARGLPQISAVRPGSHKRQQDQAVNIYDKWCARAKLPTGFTSCSRIANLFPKSGTDANPPRLGHIGLNSTFPATLLLLLVFLFLLILVFSSTP
jgi:hypothetical protein